jgi:TonB-dependent receptor
MPLDVVSGQLVSRIEVVKAVTPDMEAQSIGGTVNLVTQSPYDFQQDFMARATAQYGYEELNHKHPWSADASAGGIFGPNNQFGVLFGLNYSNRDYRTYGMYPDNWRDVAGSDRGLPTLNKATHYELQRERVGGNIVFEYRPTAEDKFYLRGLYSDFVENEHRQRYRIDFDTDSMFASGNAKLNSDGVTGSFAGAVQREDFRHEEKRKTIATMSFGGDHQHGNWQLDYNATYVRDKLAEPNQVWTFQGGSLSGTFDMSQLVFAVTPVADATASNMKFSKYTTQDNYGVDDSWNGQADLKRNLGWGDGKSYLKAGIKYRTSTKWQNNNGDTFGTGTTKFSLADFNLQGSDTHAEIENQNYRISPTIDEKTVTAFTAENLDNTAYFKFDGMTTLATDTTGDFRIGEKVLAGYAMANISFGQVAMLGGVRVEHAETDGTGFQLANGTAVTQVHTGNSYTNVLPDLHVYWQPKETVMLRAAYTNTIGRPQYADLSPAATVAYTSGSASGYEGTVSEGNIALKPYKAQNVDLMAEYYPARDTAMSLGLFYKRIKDPIFAYSETLYNTTYAGIPFDQLDYSQPRNAKYATVLGMEMNYQQQFDFLPGALSGLGAAANLTLSSSRLHMADRTDHLPFPKQANALYGLQLFYQKYGIESSVSYHFGGKYLNATGDGRATDDWFNGFSRLDARVGYDVTDRVTIFASAQNLLDAPLWEYQGGRKDWVTGYERYGRTIYMGVSAHL